MTETSDEKLKEFAELCHTMFCKLPHAKEMSELSDRKEGVCYWNLEETLDSCWECDSHKRVVTVALSYLELLEFETSDDALKFFDDAIRICQELNKLISDHPNSVSLVKSFLG